MWCPIRPQIQQKEVRKRVRSATQQSCLLRSASFSTEVGRNAAQARTGPDKPFSPCAPRSCGASASNPSRLVGDRLHRSRSLAVICLEERKPPDTAAGSLHADARASRRHDRDGNPRVPVGMGVVVSSAKLVELLEGNAVKEVRKKVPRRRHCVAPAHGYGLFTQRKLSHDFTSTTVSGSDRRGFRCGCRAES